MIISYTISTVNYLPYAISLGDSKLQYNPKHKFIIVLLDKTDAFDKSKVTHPILPIEEMAIESFTSMNEQYSIFELSCAIKPFAAAYFFEKESSCKKIFYFDCDMLVFNSLQLAEDKLNENAILITPHLVSTKPFKYREKVETGILKTGIYNAGFWGVSRNDNAISFLNWWKSKTTSFCYDDLEQGLFVDQLWLNIATVFFEDIHVLNNEGYNVAYWNLGERKINTSNNIYFAEDKKLVLFHFSGYDILNPIYLSKHFPYLNFETNPEVIPLFESYRQGALKNNWDSFFGLNPFFGKPKVIIENLPPPRETFLKRKLRKLLNNM